MRELTALEGCDERIRKIQLHVLSMLDFGIESHFSLVLVTIEDDCKGS